MNLMWLFGVICCTNIVVCLSLQNENEPDNLQSIYFNTSNLGKPTFPVWQFEYNAYFYFGAILKGTPEEASLFCNYHNMRLLAIENSAETKFLIDSLTKFMPENQNLLFWTSGRKRNGVWFWDAIGSPIHYTNWAPNEPRNIGGTSCLQAFFDYEESSIKWSVNECEATNYFICKSDY